MDFAFPRYFMLEFSTICKIDVYLRKDFRILPKANKRLIERMIFMCNDELETFQG